MQQPPPLVIWTIATVSKQVLALPCMYGLFSPKMLLPPKHFPLDPYMAASGIIHISPQLYVLKGNSLLTLD